MPQFSGTTDTWGRQIANSTYNAFQLSVTKQASHGLTLNLNYTYLHNIDDAGTQRSGWPLPASVQLNGQSWKVNRIDRALSANSTPQDLSIYGVYSLRTPSEVWYALRKCARRRKSMTTARFG